MIQEYPGVFESNGFMSWKFNSHQSYLQLGGFFFFWRGEGEGGCFSDSNNEISGPWRMNFRKIVFCYRELEREGTECQHSRRRLQEWDNTEGHFFGVSDLQFIPVLETPCTNSSPCSCWARHQGVVLSLGAPFSKDLGLHLVLENINEVQTGFNKDF